MSNEDQNHVGRLLTEGWDLYVEGGKKLEAAAKNYAEALPKVPNGHWRLVDLYGQYGHILVRLGRYADAEVNFIAAIETAMNLTNDSASIEVQFARFCLGEFYIKMRLFEKALETVMPGLEYREWKHICILDQIVYQAYVGLGDDVASAVAEERLLQSLPDKIDKDQRIKQCREAVWRG
jgi:tetratricopeptide (TPR) repeat protein